MKHRTAELTGSLLDAAVAQAQGWRFRIEGSVCEVPVSVPSFSEPPSSLGERGGEFVAWKLYSPSTRWSQAGPIIEREQITLHIAAGRSLAYVEAEFMSDEVTHYTAAADGETPLIAAMRAFVSSKLGNEVELPT